MKDFSNLELVGFLLTMIGLIAMLSILFIETEIDMGTIGVGFIGIGLTIYLLGNKSKSNNK